MPFSHLTPISVLGEIDIFEGVNTMTTNQYTAHTAAGCSIPPSLSPNSPSLNLPVGFSVSSSSSTIGGRDCGPSPQNSGCDFVDTNSMGATYGKGLNDAGGAVMVTEWTDSGIRICTLCLSLTLVGKASPEF